jgi:hypothetical protein
MAVTERESQQVHQANGSGRAPVVFIHGLWLLVSAPLPLPRAVIVPPTKIRPSDASRILSGSAWKLSHGSRTRRNHSRTSPFPW